MAAAGLPVCHEARGDVKRLPPLMKKNLLLGLAGIALALAPWLAADEADFSKLDARIQSWIDAGNYPGAGVWIVDRHGRTLHEKYWGGYTRETTVMIASTSKWLEAATMMTLVDDGKLSLDAPISKYLPQLTGEAGKNTLRQMFSHTSSLNSIPLPPADEDAGVEQLPALLAAGQPQVKPGAVFSYGGQALAVASRAVEQVTQRPWLTVFAHKIAAPLGMKHTVTGANLWIYSQETSADSFPTSNAADMMSFLQMLLHDGEYNGKRVLSEAAVREMQADQVGPAEVHRPEYPERALGLTHHGVYGLGEWRLIVNDAGQAEVLSSPSFAGFIPWIDKRRGIAAVFVGRARDGFDAFDESARLIPLVNAALDAAR